MKKTQIVIIALLLGGLPRSVPAQQRPNLADASIEDLLKIEVTSVSKKEEQLFKAPSAIYVLTAEDIRRSGATTIPEALRLVPGLAVAQIDSSKWALSARGFNSFRANKLLVLVDGRSIYTPMFSGVHWDAEEIPLEEIERIEVIRGPGATLWGANAVNGVINIISKPARETQGTLLSVGGGAVDRAFGTVRYGAPIGDMGHFRVTAKYFDRAATRVIGTGREAGDQWNLFQGTFRTDLRLTPLDSLMVTGGANRGELGQRFMLLTGVRSRELSETPERNHQHALVAQWTHTRSPRSGFSLQASHGQTSRHFVKADEDYRILNVDFQHRFALGRRQDVVWGLGQRVTTDTVGNTFMVAFDPSSHNGSLTSAFVQDEIVVVPSRLNVTLGSKFERHDVSGFNAQPSVRLSWTPVPQQNLWGAVSRAVRTASRADLALRVNYAAFDSPSGLPIVLGVLGNPNFQPENLTAYEAGYRIVPSPRVQIDTAAFYNRYHGLERETSVSFIESDPAPRHLVVATRSDNHDRAMSTGVETIARWSALRRWRIDAGYSWFRADFSQEEGVDPTNTNTPAHQWQVGSRLDLPRQWQFDTTLYYVGAFDTAEAQRVHSPARARLDVRASHVLAPGVTVDIVGQNLLDPSHQEFGNSEGSIATEIRRTAHLKLTWRF